MPDITAASTQPEFMPLFVQSPFRVTCRPREIRAIERHNREPTQLRVDLVD